MGKPASKTVQYLFKDRRPRVTLPTEDDFVETGMRMLEGVLKPFLREAALPPLKSRLVTTRASGLTDGQKSLRVFDLRFGCQTDRNTLYQFFLTKEGFIVSVKTLVDGESCEFEFALVEEREAALRRMHELHLAHKAYQPNDPSQPSSAVHLTPTYLLVNGIDTSMEIMEENALKAAGRTAQYRTVAKSLFDQFAQADFI